MMEAICPNIVGDPPAPPPVFTDVLPAAAGEKPAAVRWTPGRTAGAGTLTIQSPARKCSCIYRVTEYPTPWNGRAARLTKIDGQTGSDAEADAYDVFISRNGQDRRCDCRGFERHGHCKHVDALRCLLGNGWLDLQLSNPDTDMCDTEPPADQLEPAGFGLTAAEEAARVEILAELGTRTDLPAAVAWAESPAARPLLALIGWDTIPAADLAAMFTGSAA